MKYTDIIVISPLAEMQNLIQGAFYYNGYTIVWFDHSRGKAMKGSKGANVVAGALAQYYEYDFQIIPISATESSIRLIKTYSGWWGGIIGASSVDEQYYYLTNVLCDYFHRQGKYKGQIAV